MLDLCIGMDDKFRTNKKEKGDSALFHVRPKSSQTNPRQKKRQVPFGGQPSAPAKTGRTYRIIYRVILGVAQDIVRSDFAQVSRIRDFLVSDPIVLRDADFKDILLAGYFFAA